MTSTVLTEEFTAGGRRRQAAGEGLPVLVPDVVVGEDPGWFTPEQEAGA